MIKCQMCFEVGGTRWRSGSHPTNTIWAPVALSFVVSELVRRGLVAGRRAWAQRAGTERLAEAVPGGGRVQEAAALRTALPTRSAGPERARACSRWRRPWGCLVTTSCG